MKKNWRYLAILLLAGLAACGGQAPKQAKPQDAATPLGVASEQLYRLSQPLALAGVPAPAMIMPFSEGVTALDTANWNCDAVTASGDLTDADGDGIPVNATYDGRCTWSYSGEGGSLSSFWRFDDLNIQDPSDHDEDAGVKASGAVSWGVSGAGTNVTVNWNLERHQLFRHGGSYDFAYKGSWTVTTDSGNFTFSYDLSGTWTPSSGDDPWGDGTMTASGDFGGSGPGCAGWSSSVRLSGVVFDGGKVIGGTATVTVTDCSGSTETATITWSADRVCVSVDNHAACAPND